MRGLGKRAWRAVHLEVLLETNTAQCKALECLCSAKYHVCNLLQLQLYPYHMFVFTDYLVIYFGVSMQQVTKNRSNYDIYNYTVPELQWLNLVQLIV